MALLTPDSVRSSWVLQEVGAAWALKKPIVGVYTRRDVLDDMPFPLKSLHAFELKDLSSPEAVDQFVKGFEKVLSGQRNAA